MKKLLSKIIATTIILSGLNGFAFTDMPDSENSVLTERLGIISGYDDGTYRPDENITRAEATKIIVAANKYSEEDALIDRENEVKGVTDEENVSFLDVDKEHWAYYYIRQGVRLGFIDGFEDGTFRPDENITIVQLTKMLVELTGYSMYAQAQGGYPNGYLLYGDTLGIINRLPDKESCYDKYATRENVMNLVANTLNVPIVVIDSYAIQWDGTSQPVFSIMDGKGKDFQSLLTRRFNTYKIKGEIKEITNKEIIIEIFDACNFDDKEITEKNTETVAIKTNQEDKTVFQKDKIYKFYVMVNDSENKDYELVCGFEMTDK